MSTFSNVFSCERIQRFIQTEKFIGSIEKDVVGRQFLDDYNQDQIPEMGKIEVSLKRLVDAIAPLILMMSFVSLYSVA